MYKAIRCRRDCYLIQATMLLPPLLICLPFYSSSPSSPLPPAVRDCSACARAAMRYAAFHVLYASHMQF